MKASFVSRISFSVSGPLLCSSNEKSENCFGECTKLVGDKYFFSEWSIRRRNGLTKIF
jgi:hypothetical protein